MKTKNIRLILSLALVLGLSACNLPTSSASDTIPLKAQAGTLAAQTVAAVVTQVPAQTEAAPLPQNTPTKAPPTETITPAISLTPTTSPTPTDTARPLSAPSLKKYNFFCTWTGSGTQMEITIQWTDRSDSESGYRIYRSGQQLVELAANTTEYTDIFSVIQGQEITYAIEAFNANEISGQITLSATCE
jgi:hypothetical protein